MWNIQMQLLRKNGKVHYMSVKEWIRAYFLSEKWNEKLDDKGTKKTELLPHTYVAKMDSQDVIPVTIGMKVFTQ